jgi:hypothetical protein
MRADESDLLCSGDRVTHCCEYKVHTPTTQFHKPIGWGYDQKPCFDSKSFGDPMRQIDFEAVMSAVNESAEARIIPPNSDCNLSLTENLTEQISRTSAVFRPRLLDEHLYPV